METIIELLNTLNTLSPLAVIGLLGTVIFLLVKGKTATDTKVETLTTNHLHDLPDMAESLKRIEGLLQGMNEHIIYIRARINGK